MQHVLLSPRRQGAVPPTDIVIRRKCHGWPVHLPGPLERALPLERPLFGEHVALPLPPEGGGGRAVGA